MTSAKIKTRGTARGANTFINMQIKRGQRTFWGRQRYSVWADGEPMYPNRKRREVLPYLEWGINWRLISKCSSYVQLHAASVARHEQGMLFAAHSGSGKSTLAAALLARGWQYYCDELSMLDPVTFNVQPFPKALCIKAGSFDLVQRIGLPLWRRGHYVKAFKGPVGYINPADVPSYQQAKPCRLRFVLLPHYRGATQPCLEPVPPAEAAFELARHTLNRHHFGPELVSVLSEMVRGARCFRLEVGRLEETCALLESLIEAPSSQMG